MKNVSAALAGVLLVVCLLASQAECTKFILGGDIGWTNNADIDYTTWLADYKLKIGDTLTFVNHDTTDHSVQEVDKLGYETCGASGNKIDAPFTMSTDIAYSLTFPASTEYYFICAVPGHCLQGMKVYVQIYNADGTMSPPAAPNTTGTPPATGTPPSGPAGPSNSAALMPGSSWTSQLLVAVVAAASMVAAATTTAFA